VYAIALTFRSGKIIGKNIGFSQNYIGLKPFGLLSFVPRPEGRGYFFQCIIWV